MKHFLQSVLKNALSLALGYVFLIIIGFVGLFFLFKSLEKEPEPVPEDSILVIDLSVPVTDSPQPAMLGQMLLDSVAGAAESPHYLLEVLDAINSAARNDRINGILLHGSLPADRAGIGLSGLREIREALHVFSGNGKSVTAYLDDPGIGEYYLASAADSIHLNPFGMITLNGLSIESPFFGEAFDKYGVGVQVVRTGRYKSAVEPFVRKNMSEPNRKQLKALLQDTWNLVLSDIDHARDLEEDVFRKNGPGGVFDAKEALKNGLVDRVAYFDETLEQISGEAADDPGSNTFRQISLRRYIKQTIGAGLASQQGNIAVVYAAGSLVNQTSEPGVVDARQLNRKLRELRKDDSVRAVVLRVNSPGGSALAAESIHREALLLSREKPLVASFGDSAASGGYWVATPARKIFAEPTTITGSIGVFGLLFDIDAFADQFGVDFDRVELGPYAGMYSITREKTGKELALFQERVDGLYDDFVERVSNGRDLSEEQVHEIAEGRIHSGSAARANGLVDETGGLHAAIQYAADEANIESPEILQFPAPRSSVEALADLFGKDAPPVARFKNLDLSERLIAKHAPLLRLLRSGPGAYALLPFDIRIDF
ncbi:MAG: signal peptide peptidase SppA [Opitutales bacterium]